MCGHVLLQPSPARPSLPVPAERVRPHVSLCWSRRKPSIGEFFWPGTDAASTPVRAPIASPIASHQPANQPRRHPSYRSFPLASFARLLSRDLAYSSIHLASATVFFLLAFVSALRTCFAQHSDIRAIATAGYWFPTVLFIGPAVAPSRRRSASLRSPNRL
ncbi:hypothetical protein ACCO45_006962 [Purpureocillium lilacinum]|uniref:Uncharacterized protein n=1 Tax=Purpureocillium lilacinum TaxID=33203 RepID=A0ACC4DQZ3_PURLI